MLTNTHSPVSTKSRFTKQGVGPTLLALFPLLLLSSCATGSPPGSLRLGFSHHSRATSRPGSASPPATLPCASPKVMGDVGDVPGDVSSCATQGLPPGWPDFSSDNTQSLLAPFFSCSSPANFLALQQRVDMPQLVARLDPWSAVRLGALGPVREEASGPLNRQRTAFLLQSLERYGGANTEVLAQFVLDSCHDDDLKDIILLLAQDKRLTELLEQLPSLGAALEARGLEPSAYTERDFQWSDVGRGLSRAAKDALSTSLVVNGSQSTLMELYVLKAQLPPPYQQALDAVEHEQFERRFSAGPLVAGVMDHMTFGVPLGFYGLVAGTGHGAHSLVRGRYEQAVRELAPAALLVALYTGGRSAAWLSAVRGVPGVGTRVLSGLEVMESRVKSLQDKARQVRGLLGEEGMRELAGYIRARREAGRLVAVGGVDAALALHETRGNIAQAQAMLSKARPGATNPSTGKVSPKGLSRPGPLAAWVDEQAGLTQEVVEAKLVAAELESTSPRLSKDVAVLENQRPSLESPPLEAQGNPRWSEYVAYYEKRLAEIKGSQASKGPLRWDAYEQLWGWFTRGLAFERAMVKLLKVDAGLPRAQRRFLGHFDKPRVEAYVGVKKPSTGLRFADVLIIEEGQFAKGPPRIETMSFKSRDLSNVSEKALSAQMIDDAEEALRKYGGTLNIRREALQPFLHEGSEVPVQRVRLVYEGGVLIPKNVEKMNKAVKETRERVPGVEVLVQ